MSPGQELLLHLLRRGEDGAAPLSPETSQADWAELLEVAPRGLHPYLAHRLQPIEPTGIPAAVRFSLEAARRAAAISLLRRQAVLRRLLPALEAAGIPAVVLKGGALAYLSYPDPSLRPMDDLDLWVQPKDLDRGVMAAGAAGLAYSSRYRDRTAADKDQQSAVTRVLEDSRSGLVVELHGALNSLTGFSSAWLERAWERREERLLGGTRGSVMHPEDMLTHLAIHCSRHHLFESGLRPLLDISLWLESDGHRISWPGLLREWERERVTTWALLPISLTNDLLGASVPAEVTSRLDKFPEFTELRAIARQQVFGTPLKLPPTMALLAASTPGEGTAWMLRRLTTWYWKGPPGIHRSAGQIVGDALRRMGHDLRHKVGPYLRGLWQGHFWGTDFRQRRELALGRRRLAALAEQLESPTTPPSREPIQPPN